MKNKRLTQLILILTCVAFAVPFEGAQRSPEKIWKTFCIACHGATGKGDVPSGVALEVPDLTSEDFAKKSDAKTIIERIREGKKNEKGVMRMIAYKNLLKEKEIEGLVEYVLKLNHNRNGDKDE